MLLSVKLFSIFVRSCLSIAVCANYWKKNTLSLKQLLVNSPSRNLSVFIFRIPYVCMYYTYLYLFDKMGFYHTYTFLGQYQQCPVNLYIITTSTDYLGKGITGVWCFLEAHRVHRPWEDPAAIRLGAPSFTFSFLTLKAKLLCQFWLRHSNFFNLI